MVVLVLFSVAFVQSLTLDPGPGLLRSKDKTRNLECERLTTDSAAVLRPGQIAEVKPRGDYIDRSLVVCKERLMRPGLRADRDEAILSKLDSQSAKFAVAARSRRPELEEAIWMVESYTSNASVSTKVSFAAKNALMNQGLSVSDRLPTLAAGDISVITRMSPTDAYPAACARYFASGSMGDNDALLAVVNRDPRETILHAGLCHGGHWTWLQ